MQHADQSPFLLYWEAICMLLAHHIHPCSQNSRLPIACSCHALINIMQAHAAVSRALCVPSMLVLMQGRSVFVRP